VVALEFQVPVLAEQPMEADLHLAPPRTARRGLMVVRSYVDLQH